MTYRRPLNEADQTPFAFEDGARILRLIWVIALIVVLLWALGSLALEHLSLGTVLGFGAGVLVSLIGFACLIGYSVDQ